MREPITPDSSNFDGQPNLQQKLDALASGPKIGGITQVGLEHYDMRDDTSPTSHFQLVANLAPHLYQSTGRPSLTERVEVFVFYPARDSFEEDRYVYSDRTVTRNAHLNMTIDTRAVANLEIQATQLNPKQVRASAMEITDKTKIAGYYTLVSLQPGSPVNPLNQSIDFYLRLHPAAKEKVEAIHAFMQSDEFVELVKTRQLDLETLKQLLQNKFGRDVVERVIWREGKRIRLRRKGS